jgi:hypothetical protein
LFVGTVSLEEAKISRASPIPLDQLKDLTVSIRAPISDDDPPIEAAGSVRKSGQKKAEHR